MRSMSALGACTVLFTFSQLACALSLDTDVVIVSNNDLDPSNPNRDSALLLRTPATCLEAARTCAELGETLLPPPTGIESDLTQDRLTSLLTAPDGSHIQWVARNCSFPTPTHATGLTMENLTTVLTSERHGAMLEPGSSVWMAGRCGCAAFTPSSSSFYDDSDWDDLATPLPVLCTNSAPLARSNVTSYDIARQIDISTPRAGILRGFRDKFTWRFLGIKYAESMAGKGRFQPPKALDVPLHTVRTALEYGPYCAQPPHTANGEMIYDEEDCLSLNVYSPIATGSNTRDVAPKLPVMFYIHGGALNIGGSGPFPYNRTTNGYVGNSISNVFDGTNLVSYGGVVLVTINYRLNAFGWFNASNAALKDTLLALHWVQDNIEAFGGDPTKVLIFGESAGGVMTKYLLGTNPKYTQGLFSAAIMQSSSGTAFPFYSPELSLNVSLNLAKHLGCASNASFTLSKEEATCVQGIPSADLALAANELGILWNIVVDGDYILNDIKGSILDGVYARVPTLWSTNECETCSFMPSILPPTAPPSTYVQMLPSWFTPAQVEMILNQTALYPYDTSHGKAGMSGTIWTLVQLLTDLFLLCPTTHLASLQSKANPGDVYHVVFATGLSPPLLPNPTMCRGQVCHADELYWVFGTAETDGLYQPLTQEQIGVMREVMKRWTEMAWTGSPNYVGAEMVWEAYDGSNDMVVTLTGSVKEGYRVAQCDFIVDQIGFAFGDGVY